MHHAVVKRAPRKGALFAFCLFVFSAPLTAAQCPSPDIDERATVRYIHDGDTLHLGDGRKVRLIGINTPEVAHDRRPAEPLAQAAKQALEAAIPPGSSVGLDFGAERHDRHGRVLAHLIDKDGRNLNLMLIEQGLAQAIAIPPNVRWTECYWQAEQTARDAGLGLWRHPRYRTLAAHELNGNERGFYRLQGRVVRVGESRKAWWLDLDGPAVLRIDKRDAQYFDMLDMSALKGKLVEARGWLYPYRAKLSMGVRHPRSLQVMDRGR
ncbi:MAG: thermonuclease family protein [Gammaproteobacteria bacterium]|nr:thermonuclease family protein [Gammaproteobacteria bacterium]